MGKASTVVDQRISEMELRVVFQNKALSHELLKGNKEAELPRDIHVKFNGVEFKKSPGAPEIAAFLITVAANIPASLAADIIMAWLYGRFNGHAEILSIEKTEIRFSESGKIKKVIKRTIKKERR
jgi:hypothetical protein